MSKESIDYQAVLDDLRAKRDEVSAAIDALEKLLGLGEGGGQSVPPHGGKHADSVVSEDAFLGMSTPAAAEKYLRMAKRPQTTADIAQALQRGGIHSTSDNFTNTVYTALTRNEKVIRLGRGKWSLREWHPGARVDAKKKANGIEEASRDDEGDADGIST